MKLTAKDVIYGLLAIGYAIQWLVMGIVAMKVLAPYSHFYATILGLIVCTGLALPYIFVWAVEKVKCEELSK